MTLIIFWSFFMFLSPHSVLGEARFPYNHLDMGKSPYVLKTGEPYRDLDTVEASRSVAEFALRFQPQKKLFAKQNRETARFGEISRTPPNFIDKEPYAKGNLQEDNEIFDFTDSRFINPPPDSRQNFPLVEEDLIDNADNAPAMIGQDTAGGYYAEQQEHQYSYNPTPIQTFTSHFQTYPTNSHETENKEPNEPFVHLGSTYSTLPPNEPYPFSTNQQPYKPFIHQVQNENNFEEISKIPLSEHYALDREESVEPFSVFPKFSTNQQQGDPFSGQLQSQGSESVFSVIQTPAYKANFHVNVDHGHAQSFSRTSFGTK